MEENKCQTLEPGIIAYKKKMNELKKKQNKTQQNKKRQSERKKKNNFGHFPSHNSNRKHFSG